MDKITHLTLPQKRKLKATGVENILFPYTTTVNEHPYPIMVRCYEPWNSIFKDSFRWDSDKRENWYFDRNEVQTFTFVDIWQLKREGNYENQIISEDI